MCCPVFGSLPLYILHRQSPTLQDPLHQVHLLRFRRAVILIHGSLLAAGWFPGTALARRLGKLHKIGDCMLHGLRTQPTWVKIITLAARTTFPAKRLNTTALKIIEKSRRQPVLTPYLNKFFSDIATMVPGCPVLAVINCTNASFMVAGRAILLQVVPGWA